MARKAEAMFELFNIRESADAFEESGFSLNASETDSRTLSRFVFDPVNRKFLCADGDWTNDAAEATNFIDMESVIRAWSKYGMRKAEVLLRSTQNVEFRLPLRKGAAN